MNQQLDYFDRQKRIPGWNQEQLENQVVFCLGVGGLGCSVALEVVRLGVKKVYLLDKDTVDYHNLNRQILFSKEDLGKPKVEAAANALKHHNLRTEIIPLNLDALKHWDKIVEIARDCNVIFNMIDVGDYFDIAVQSLAIKLNLPIIIGGTFQAMLTIDYCSGKKKVPRAGVACRVPVIKN